MKGGDGSSVLEVKYVQELDLYSSGFFEFPMLL